MAAEGSTVSVAAAANPIPYSTPTPGASLILSHTPSSSQSILIIGSGNLATSRAFAALEAGLQPLLLSFPSSPITRELQWRASQGQVQIIEPEQQQWEALINASPEAWNILLDRIDQFPPLPEVSAADGPEKGAGPRLFAICVTDTLTSSYPTQPLASSSSSTTTAAEKGPLDLALARAGLLHKLCRRRRLLINVADRPQLCDFSFPAAHRFPLIHSTSSPSSSPPSSSSLQIAITTNGKGCRLASRLRREIVSALPRNVGDAVETVGWLRSLAKDEVRQATAAVVDGSGDGSGEGGAETPRQRPSFSSGPGTPRPEKRTGYFAVSKKPSSDAQVDEEDTSFDPQPLNSPVPQLSIDQSRSTKAASKLDPEQAQRRMRWVSQISEYWPIEYLGSLRSKPDEVKELLSTYGGARSSGSSKPTLPPAPPSAPAALNIAPTFTSPFSSDLSVSPQNHAASAVSDDIDEAQDRALRAAHDSMRRRSEAAAIPVPELDHFRHGDMNNHGSGGEESNADRISEMDEAGRGRSSMRPNSRSMRNPSRSRSVHSLSLSLPPSASLDARQGHVYLLGSGPGHPGLLTQFAYRLLTSPSTDLILSDKLVPASILALIPPTTSLEIARKFPGNAEAAQSELIEKALQAAQGEGKTVVRLKQGDPFVYGRGGEEVLAFRAAGVSCSVVPGISSAFAGPLMLGIAVTQRGAADTFVLCTGVGRGGKSVALPGYSRSTTIALLMGVARLKSVVHTLVSENGTVAAEGRKGPVYPPYLPVAIIERASSADQRLVASTLENIVNALERCGEQRPPGMILIGWTVLALEGEKGDATILDDGESLSGAQLESRDRARVERWLDGKGYIVREGLDEAYAQAAAAFLPVSTCS